MTKEELDAQIKCLEDAIWKTLREQSVIRGSHDQAIIVSEFCVYLVTGIKPDWRT